ncbi:hypothetical protein LEP1GSC158_2194 [Leptospira interrogans serovar Zanoni str. LT2156]|uniref:Uncharacterized protein n=1 Tax=Leptospira interrogans serovar Zanoni str. LT2156 TaxID=1001601 RepID=M6HGL5_LEPIR|nr:hypothetical protein LEP1GSC158_2194 [Leptospira interrogans serovar Zanoni str. LT2156]
MLIKIDRILRFKLKIAKKNSEKYLEAPDVAFYYGWIRR